MKNSGPPFVPEDEPSDVTFWKFVRWHLEKHPEALKELKDKKDEKKNKEK